MKNDIGPVEQNLLTMMKVLSIADQDLIIAEMHQKVNRLTTAHMVMMDEIDVFNVDPYRYGSIALLQRLNSVLKEACK